MRGPLINEDSSEYARAPLQVLALPMDRNGGNKDSGRTWQCPLYPRKRTFNVASAMSAKCQ